MAICPIDSRYRTDMGALFDEEARLASWVRVEVSLAKAHAALGHIPKAAAAEIEQAAPKVRLKDVLQIEAAIHHDLMAMVKALAARCPKHGGAVHLGATSYDIEDTALALTLHKAGSLIRSRMVELRKTLKILAIRHAKTVCIGRTHGQHAVPTTYGMKFALYYAQFSRHLARLDAALSRISAGKMSGAVGTMATFGKDAHAIQDLVMKDLGLQADAVSSQIVARDRHAELLMVNALVASTLEQMAKELRNLQRTEIGELAESFSPAQVGSSTMPQKRNPHKSERICSLARIVRAQVPVALENIATEHERDLTNSAAERYIFPESFITLDFMLMETDRLFSNLQFFAKNIEKNLSLTQGLCLSERLMMALVSKGMGRQEAHELMRIAARECYEKNLPFGEVLGKNAEVKKLIRPDELKTLLDPHTYIGQAEKIVQKAVGEE